jgi:hypothetical protein
MQKKEYMLKLDAALREIEKQHGEVIAREHYELPRTIGERIQLECKAKSMQ